MIKDTNIIGNGPEVLRRTDMVGGLRFDEGGWVCGKDGGASCLSWDAHSTCK